MLLHLNVLFSLSTCNEALTASMAQWKFLHHRRWGVLDVAHREVPDALGNVLNHLVVDVDIINTINRQHSEWNSSHVIQCINDDFLWQIISIS